MDIRRKILGKTAVSAVLLLAAATSGCSLLRGSPDRTPPHVVASLSDHQYNWFLYSGEDLYVWRVCTSSPKFQRYSAPDRNEKHFRGWQLEDSWLYYLTNSGLYRIGRFPPNAGTVQQVAGRKINSRKLGQMSSVLVQDAQIYIGADLGLFCYDSQSDSLTRITGQRIRKLKETQHGILAMAERDLCLLDTSQEEPMLRRLRTRRASRWTDPAVDAYVAADLERNAIVAIHSPNEAVEYELADLGVRLDATEELTEAFHYGGRLWLMTSKPRLITVLPSEEQTVEYSLYHVQGSQSPFHLQDGRMWCGAVLAEEHASRVYVGAVRFWPGDIKPLSPIYTSSDPAQQLRQAEKLGGSPDQPTDNPEEKRVPPEDPRHPLPPPDPSEPPNNPEIPVPPEDPDYPNIPEEPERPLPPDDDEFPDEPDRPGLPDRPEVPNIPDRPATSDAQPSSSSTDVQKEPEWFD